MKKIIALLSIIALTLGIMACATTVVDAEQEVTEEAHEDEIIVLEEPLVFDNVIVQEETETPAEPEIEPLYQLTDEERLEVVKCVIAEARGCSLECQMAVAQCVRDRALDREQTVMQVLHAKNQFVIADSTDIVSAGLLERIEDAVMFVFDENANVYPEIQHFHASYCNPYWSDSFTCWGEIDGVKFYN